MSKSALFNFRSANIIKIMKITNETCVRGKINNNSENIPYGTNKPTKPAIYPSGVAILTIGYPAALKAI